MLNDRHLNIFKNGSIFSARGRRFSSQGGTLYGGESISLVDSMDYRGGVTSCVDVLDPVNQPELNIEYRGTTAIIYKDDSRYTIDSGEERQINFAPVDVDIRPPSEETITKENPADRGPAEVEVPKKKAPVSEKITPKITVRNHGNMKVYGKKDFVVVPANSNDPVARSIIARSSNGAKKEASSNTKQIIIIEEDK